MFTKLASGTVYPPIPTIFVAVCSHLGFVLNQTTGFVPAGSLPACVLITPIPDFEERRRYGVVPDPIGFHAQTDITIWMANPA